MKDEVDYYAFYDYEEHPETEYTYVAKDSYTIDDPEIDYVGQDGYRDYGHDYHLYDDY